MFCEDDYDIGVQIGKGRFGEVFRAKPRVEYKDDVAIKVIKKEGLPDHVRRKIEDEMLFHRNLKHPHIIQLISSFESEVAYYIVMELSTENLYSFLHRKNQPFPEENAISILQQLLTAVNYLQEKHCLIHRDLKLSNILISEIRGENHMESFDLRVKLCDFGLATKVFHPDDLHYSFCGTAAYLSPEVVNNCGYGFGTDIWGIGKIFEALVTGEAPSTSTLTEASKNSDNPRIIKGYEERLREKMNESYENVISTINNIPSISSTARDFLKKALNPVSLFSFVQRCAYPLFSSFIAAVSLFFSLNQNPSLRPSAGQLLRHQLFMKRKERLRENYHLCDSSEISPMTDGSFSTHPSSISPRSSSGHFSFQSINSSNEKKQHQPKLPLPVVQESRESRESLISHTSFPASLSPQVPSSRPEPTQETFDLHKLWERTVALSSQLPSFLSINGSSLTSLSSSSTSPSFSAERSFETLLFLTNEGNLFYFHEKYRICFLQQERMIMIDKLDDERKNLLSKEIFDLNMFDVSSSSCSDLSSSKESYLLVFQENNYPPHFLASSLFSSTSYRRSYPLSQFTEGRSSLGRPLNDLVLCSLGHVSDIIRETAGLIPRFILYYREEKKNVSFSSSDYVKCLFMSNDPKPDFHIQWKDETRLRYSLATGKIFIHKPRQGVDSHSKTLCWEGSMSEMVRGPDSSSSSSHHVSTSSCPSSLFPYLADSQTIIKRCFLEKKKRCKVTERSVLESKLCGPTILWVE
jgi:serine/threonine protein kinase